MYIISSFAQKRQNPLFLFFDKYEQWHADEPWAMSREFLDLTEEQKKQFLGSELWAMSSENVGTSACSVRSFYSCYCEYVIRCFWG